MNMPMVKPIPAELIAVESLDPEKLFAPGGVDALLDKLEAEAKSYVADAATMAGRETIRSLAAKIARSKTTLDELGKNLVAKWKSQSALVDAERRKVRDRLDALKDEVRAPLTAFEEAEASRVSGHEQAIEKVKSLAVLNDEDRTSTAIEARLADLGKLSQRDWQEFDAPACAIIDETRAALRKALDAAKKREAEQMELARLRAEQAERDREAHERRIADTARAEAESKAKREADEVAGRAEADRRRVEQDKVEADRRAQQAESDRIAAIEKSDRDAKAAAEKAERDREAAVRAERQRIESEQRAEQAAAAKREANKRHAAKINNEVKAALVGGFGISDDLAKLIIAAIARGEIPHTRISY